MSGIKTLSENIQSKLVQLKHYRDHGCQLDHARTIAEGRILQLEQVAAWVAELPQCEVRSESALPDIDTIARIFDPDAMRQYERDFAISTAPTISQISAFPAVKKARQKAEAVLALFIDSAQEAEHCGVWLPVANYPDDNSVVLAANPEEGRLPVIAWKVEDTWYHYDLRQTKPLDPQPTIWTEWPKLPKASSVPSAQCEGGK